MQTNLPNCHYCNQLFEAKSPIQQFEGHNYHPNCAPQEALKKPIYHDELVRKLKKPGLDILKSLTPEKCDLLHMAIGISTEAGELLDTVKKHVFYEQPLKVNKQDGNLVEELGDLEFYMEGLRQNIGITRAETLLGNIKKLLKRYESLTFTNHDAEQRADKNTPHEA